ncbi:MAG: hypothetical protein J3Q66DRAFT_321431 [Benniella sp.]|nr:MAG: hypothetical protein J3Q66DRAFT_321431 [Benniella sp.]
MEHTDKDLAEIPRSTTRTSSRTIAMALPEILYNVFTFLDKPSLLDCLQVSRLWHTHGRVLAWRTISLPIFSFVDLAFDLPIGSYTMGDDTESYDERHDRLQNFIENCRHTRSITVTHPEQSRWLPRIRRLNTLDNQAAGLRNLVHFAVWSPETKHYSEELYRVAGAILAQNPGVQEIEWHAGEGYNEQSFVDLVLERTGKRLKRLSILGKFTDARLRILEHLIKASEMRQEQQQYEKMAMARDGTESRSGHNNDGGYGFELEELLLKDIRSYTKFGHGTRWIKLDSGWLYDFPGTLPLRALTILNFETRIPAGDYTDPNCSFLPILMKCPHLEKLCVSFDLCPDSPNNPPRGVRTITAYSEYHDGHHGYEDDLDWKDIWQAERDDFVEIMNSHCPKLREIEFGMLHQFASPHYTKLLEKYGPQLESLSIWGDCGGLPNFEPNAFMTLIGPPISRPTGVRSHCLTQLNISGSVQLRHCAWIALYQLPLLKQFRARDVPLDARKLIRKGGWACIGLEVLEVFIRIPREWEWCSSHGMWTDHTHCESSFKASNECRFEVEDESEDEMNENGHCDVNSTSKRQWKDSMTMEPRKKTRKYKEIQVKVCEVLGRLTHLRELRIDGGRDFEDDNKNWSCLELTLETGLDRLAPLREAGRVWISMPDWERGSGVDSA